MDDTSDQDYEMEESETSESQDRLSELPLSLKFHILSFLPMVDVVWTSILSKRWKDLWTTVPCLYFCDDVDDEKADVERNFRNFINGALLFWRGAKILKFDIDLKKFSMSLAKDIDLWVIFAKKYNVEELIIDLRYSETFDWDNAVEGSKRDIYIAPQCLNSCSSIKALSLVGYNLRIPEPPLWNQLRSLRIDGFCLSECLINRVLSGTPKLEVFDLHLLESNENLSIHSRSLKKLKIEKYLYSDGDEPSTTSVLRIGCPNLEMFEIFGLLYSKCVLINTSSLIYVNLGFDVSHHYEEVGLSGEELLGQTLRQIFPTIRDVEKITLSDWCVQVLGAMENKYLLSPLSNVKWLKLEMTFIGLEEMAHILRIFCNVKKLVIYELTYRAVFIGSGTDLPSCNLFQLKTIEINMSSSLAEILPLLEFLLKQASVLENTVIRAHMREPLPEKDLLLAAEKVPNMRRSSPMAEVILIDRREKSSDSIVKLL